MAMLATMAEGKLETRSQLSPLFQERHSPPLTPPVKSWNSFTARMHRVRPPTLSGPIGFQYWAEARLVDCTAAT